jgi:hypothetical protein
MLLNCHCCITPNIIIACGGSFIQNAVLFLSMILLKAQLRINDKMGGKMDESNQFLHL